MKTLFEVEKEHILAALAACDGNRTYAAKALGIGVHSLARRLKKFGVPPGKPGKPAFQYEAPSGNDSQKEIA